MGGARPKTQALPWVRSTHQGVIYLPRAGVMAAAMYETKLDEISWRKLECRVPRHCVGETDQDIPDDSESNDEYPNLFKWL